MNHASAPILNPQELTALTRWKWQYSLEAAGFTTPQARALIFCRWRRDTGRLFEGDLDTPVTCIRCWRDFHPSGELVARIAQGLHIVHRGCGQELHPGEAA